VPGLHGTGCFDPWVRVRVRLRLRVRVRVRVRVRIKLALLRAECPRFANDAGLD